MGCRTFGVDQRPATSPPWERKQRRSTGSGLERAFRIGYVAKGVLYLCAGGLLIESAVRSGLAPTESVTASAVVASPLAAALLLLAAFSAAAYAAWLLICATVDRVPRTTIADLWVRRAAYAASGLLHTALALYAAQLLSRRASGELDQGWLTRVLSWGSGGEMLIGSLGVALAAFSAREILRANIHEDGDRLDLRDMRPRVRPWVRRMGTFGRTIRGVVLALVSMSFIFAAARRSASEPMGLTQTVFTIESWAFGWIVLGIAGIGLLAYGLFELIESGHRVVRW